MNPTQVEVQGTLQPDGSLVLDEKPSLPPGRVKVIMGPISETPARPEDWWQYMQRTRRELEQKGYPTMTAAEVTSHVEWLRGDDDRIEEVYRQAEEERRRQGNPDADLLR